jgi:hypothetical protein
MRDGALTDRELEICAQIPNARPFKATLKDNHESTNDTNEIGAESERSVWLLFMLFVLFVVVSSLLLGCVTPRRVIRGPSFLGCGSAALGGQCLCGPFHLATHIASFVQAISNSAH